MTAKAGRRRRPAFAVMLSDAASLQRLDRVGVLLEERLGTSGRVVLVVDGDGLLERAVGLVVEVDAADPLGDLGELVGETGGGQEVQTLGLTERALRVLEVLHRVLGVRPERTPQ